MNFVPQAAGYEHADAKSTFGRTLGRRSNTSPGRLYNNKLSCRPTVWPIQSMSLSIDAVGDILGGQLERHVRPPIAQISEPYFP